MESGSEKAMSEATAMDRAAHPHQFTGEAYKNCCYDHNIGKCLPKVDDDRCDWLCKTQFYCDGGKCVLRSNQHFCHCAC